MNFRGVDLNKSRGIFEWLTQTPISEPILVDAIELYANQEISDDDKDEFLEKYTSHPQYVFVKKAVLDVVAAVIAADEIESEDVFEETISLLNVYEHDEIISKIKSVMLHKMMGDAVDDMPAAKEGRFFSRMRYTEKCFSNRKI